jgi:hypothetical protein
MVPEILQHLVAEFYLIVFINDVSTAQETHHISITNTSRSILLKKKPLFVLSHTKEQNSEFFIVKAGGTYHNHCVSKRYPNIALAIAA